MPRGRPPAPGKVYYLGRLRFRPGIDPPKLRELLEMIATAPPDRRADLLRAALLEGARHTPNRAASAESSEVENMLSDLFGSF